MAGQYIDLPFWLSSIARWCGISVAIQNPPFVSPGGWLIFLDSQGGVIDRERLSAILVDHDIYIADLPRGTNRLRVDGAEPNTQKPERPIFFPAIKPFIQWLDPFDFRGVARRLTAQGSETTANDVGYAFRRKWKAGRHRNEGYGYRRWRSRHVGQFAPQAPPAAVGPVAFILATPAEALPAQSLEKLAAALAAQTDRHWRLLVPAIDDAGKQLAALGDDRIVAVKAGARDSLAKRLHAALAGAGIDLVSFLAKDAIPTPDAVAMVRACFAAHPQALLAYTDEEVVDDAGRPDRGLFKPAFSPHFLRAENYVGHLAVLRRAEIVARGGIREEDADAEIYALLLRYTAGIDAASVLHIPRVACTSATEPDAGSAAVPALRAAPELPPQPPKVSIVIPTRDRADLLSVALRSLVDRTLYKNIEIVIVDNGSVEPRTFALLESFRQSFPTLRIVRDEGDFNFPRLINKGVAACTGELICLLNNDIEVVDGGWLEAMVRLTLWPNVGIVGARLLYPGRTVQHAGVIVGLHGAVVHWFAGAREDAPGPLRRLQRTQNLTAVTGACMLITRQCLNATGPLDEAHLAVNFNDIDLCLKARAAGFEIVWTPDAELIHHESASRGADASPEKRARSSREFEHFDADWHVRQFEDPYYSPNYDRFSVSCALAYPPRDLRPRTAHGAAG